MTNNPLPNDILQASKVLSNEDKNPDTTTLNPKIKNDIENRLNLDTVYSNSAISDLSINIKTIKSVKNIQIKKITIADISVHFKDSLRIFLLYQNPLYHNSNLIMVVNLVKYQAL